MINYSFPCYPGDEIWYIEMHKGKPALVRKGYVKMISFTKTATQILLEGQNDDDIKKALTWQKYAFVTYREAVSAAEKLTIEFN